MAWGNSVVTHVGIDFLNESLAGRSLTIERAVGGTGTVETSELMAATGVLEQKQTLALLGLEKLEDGIKVGIQVSNRGLSESYQLQQVGVYARMTDEEESHLFFIMQDNKGIYIPAEDENPDFLLEMYGVIAIVDGANININVDSSVVVSEPFMRETIAIEIKKHNNSADAHPDIRNLIASIGSGVGSAIIQDITIAVADWYLPEKTAEEYFEDYPYVAEVPVEKVTEDFFGELALDKTSLKPAMIAGFCPTLETVNGAIRFWSVEIPGAEINGTLMLRSENLITSDGSYSTTMVPASATQLGGVIIEEGSGLKIDETGRLSVDVASTEEANSAIDEIYGNDSSGTGSDGTQDDSTSDDTGTSGTVGDYEVATDEEVTDTITDIFG